MKIAFIVPVLDDVNLDSTITKINSACDVDHDIYFAVNGKLNSFFTQVRTNYLNDSKIKAFMVDKPVNEHKLITLGMEMTEDYDATIIYSGKEEPNEDIIKAFITSWKAGNKIVYLKKQYSGFKKITTWLKRAFYTLGIKILGIFKDRCAETDIQLLDQDVVKTINQLPAKNRQLRVLDSFVGYTIDVIQIEIDGKMKENKNYDEKIKPCKTLSTLSIVSILVSIAILAVTIVGLSLDWNINVIVYITLFALVALGIVLTYIFAIRSALYYRIGVKTDLSELNDLKNKLEKYNITHKN